MKFSLLFLVIIFSRSLVIAQFLSTQEKKNLKSIDDSIVNIVQEIQLNYKCCAFIDTVYLNRDNCLLYLSGFSINLPFVYVFYNYFDSDHKIHYIKFANSSLGCGDLRGKRV